MPTVTSSRPDPLPATAGLGRAFRGGTILGPERATEIIEIVDYDPAWPSRFEIWRERLASAVGPSALRIEHVGSTAVPGLASKPIVDIQVSVGDVADESAYVSAIESLGFVLRYRQPDLGWRYFRPPPGIRREAQVHVCTAGGAWERSHLLFRDYLRAHPERASAYGALKRELASRHPVDRIAYTDAKDPFIDETLALAENWARETGWVA